MAYQIEQSGGRWMLTLDGMSLIEHTAEAPFITAVRHEKTCKTVREVERVPLTAVERPTADTVVFSGCGHCVTAVLSAAYGGVQLALSGESGWAYELRLSAVDGEAVFGGGQYRKVNLRGETVVNAVSERINAPTLPWALCREKRRKDADSPISMPVFVTDHGRLMAFGTTADGASYFGEGAYRFRFDRCPDTLLLARGADYRALSRILAMRYRNRQYLPDWCHDGMILSIHGGTNVMLNKTVAMLDVGTAICGVWSRDWSGELRTSTGKQIRWNWEADEALYPRLRDAISVLNDHGVRFLAYINPYLAKDGHIYDYCKEKGWLITRQNGEVCHIRSATFDAGMIDLTNPDAAAYTKDVLIKRNMLDLGVSGWMADFGGYLPADCVLHDGDPKLLHNEWPVLWAKLNREAIEEYGRNDVFFFMRSGYLGIQEYAPALWSGDQHTDHARNHEFPHVMPASFSLGFSGVPVVHCGAGGAFSHGTPKRDEELCIRRMELSTFSLLMHSHESTGSRADAQFDADPVKPHTVRLANVHKALKPYLAKCVGEAQAGIPAMRPDFYEAMDCGASHDPDSYFLGDDLYVCPVIRRKARTRKVFLPKGVWVHFWSGKVYTGGEGYPIPAPLGEIPVFYRAGSGFIDLFRETGGRYNLLEWNKRYGAGDK